MDRRPAPRQRLIASAVALLAAEGVEAVTLRGIAKHTGVSHGAPLRHFAGRAELLSAVAATGFTELYARREELPGGPPRARLIAACRAYVGFALETPAMFELMFRHDLLDTGDAELLRASSAVFDFFAELAAAASTGDTDPRLVAASLWAALHGLAELWLWGGLDKASFAPSIDVPLAVTLDAYLGSA
ncbi:TetR/AcrR family transcriptional regulator [Amycolatopsis magusensis]|uniref:TetR/AcrR family transcriptional regulator n=1 Tax=Amycolatopsis magusensis TaxID=882444 RepID=UPI0037BBF05A